MKPAARWLVAPLLFVIGVYVRIDRSPMALAQRVVATDQTSRHGTIERGNTIEPSAIIRDVLWTQPAFAQAGSVGYPLPVVGGGALYLMQAPPNTEAMSAIDLRTGHVRWASDIVAHSEAYRDGVVYCVTAYRRFDVPEIVALDARTGTIRWRTPGTWVAIYRQLAIVTNGSHVDARDAATGRLFWSDTWDGTTPLESSLIGSTLFLRTNEDGAMLQGVGYAYDIRTGHALWRNAANALIGTLSADRIALDVTYAPRAYSSYAPLQVAVLARETGRVESMAAYAPDRNEFAAFTVGAGRSAADVTATDEVISFRIGDGALYRYPISADPDATSPTRFDLRSALSLGEGVWLVRTSHGSSGLARFEGGRVLTQPLAGLDSVDSSFVVGSIGLVVAGDRALVFDAHTPLDIERVHLPCRSVTRAFIADGELVAVCTAPQAQAVGIALPVDFKPSPEPTSIPVVARPMAPRPPEVHAYDVPTRSVRLSGVAFASDGTLWFGERLAEGAPPGGAQPTDRVAHLGADGHIVEYPIPTTDAGIGAIVRGPDGAMWFTESDALKLGRISSSGAITEFPLPATLFKAPMFPIRGSSLVPLPAPVGHGFPRRHRYSKLGGLAVGPDGALWTTAPSVGALVRVTTSGAVRVIALPDTFAYPGAISLGPEGDLWFTLRDGIGRYRAASGPREYAIEANRQPITSIVWGPDGNMWFSFFDGRVGRISPVGQMRTFPAPVVTPPNGPLIGGCDGSLYMAAPFGTALWRVSTSGTFEEFDVPYSIGAFARSPRCTLGFIESQPPSQSHVGTISF